MKRILAIDGASVALGRRQVLSDISLDLAAGELTALIGPNGSGKSTLLAAVAGLVPLAAGTVQICGRRLDEQTRAARECLGYMVAQETLPGLLTPRQCLELFSRSRGLRVVPEITWKQAEDLGLTPWMDEWLMACSLGTRQKLSVLLALLGSPPLIVLDEPLNALDPVSALALKRWLKTLTAERACSVLMATHDLAVVESLNDHILVLLEGRIVLDWDRERMAREVAGGDQGLEARIVEVLGRP
ncbi:MAG: ABC transporter ATP-binding protein [Xanthomonadales bacterium]|nr:ABC transporter ATP-binding protein [Xanthomonadales bacterium]